MSEWGLKNWGGNGGMVGRWKWDQNESTRGKYF